MGLNLPYYAIPRTFQVPPDYSILNLTTNNFTDTVINNLYTRFACCYGERINSINQARKKGKICKIDSDTKYLLMALYVLRNWYNPNTIAASTILSAQWTNLLNRFSITLYAVSSDGSMNISTPIGTISGLANIYSIVEFTATMNPGFTATVINLDGPTSTIQVNCTIPNINIWIYFYIGVGSGGANNYWFPLSGTTFNPCLTLQQVTLIIERCFKICGCQNCNNATVMEEDNTYTPFGQLPPPSLPLQTYLTYPIYEVKYGGFPCINPYWS